MLWIFNNVVYNDVFFTILISTLIIKLLTVYTDYKSRLSSIKMAEVQPELQKLQKKYASDPRKAQEKQREFMKEKGVSMTSSCLPMLITMPLFICFIAAFRFWSYEEMVKLLVSDNPVKVFESFRFLWVNNIWQPDNGVMPVIMSADQFFAIPNLEKLVYFNSHPEVLERLADIGIAVRTAVPNANGMMFSFIKSDASVAAYNATVKPLIDLYAGYNNGWFIMPLLAGGTNLISTLLTQKNTPPPASGQPNSGKMMMYIMPIMSFVICLTQTAAFSLYWIFSSIIAIIVTLVINKLVTGKSPKIVEVKK